MRLVFCLFADDTGIFERDIFLDLILQRSQIDGSDIGRLLNELFDVLNTPEGRRQNTLDEDLRAFRTSMASFSPNGCRLLRSTAPCVRC